MSQLELSEISAMHSSTAAMVGDPKTPYPKAVFFIIATELSERFSYYGMRAVLTIYMRNMLKFSEDEATTLYHTFLLLCYGLPIVWGVIADSYLGKFKTIWIVSVFFAVGNIILAVSSIPPLNLPAIPLALIGLVAMSIGTGGMKPCVCPFGGEQFVLPEQTKYLQQFFSVFFFAVTIGNMVSTVITPVFRRDVHCFGLDSCYPLAFGVPALIMIVAVCVFVAGKSLYKINKPEGNMCVKVVRCMTHALVNKKKSDTVKTHWLDHADDKYELRLITDIQMLLRVLVYYLPIPMFFALYEQLGSRWTLQATRMTGQIGSFIDIKPDQMQVSNAILMFIFIPIFQTVVYPLLGKCNLLRRPLQRMAIGGFLAAASFGVAGIVEMQIEKSHYTPPTVLETHLNFINTLPCSIKIEMGVNLSTIEAKNTLIIPVMNVNHVNATLTLNESCDFNFNELGIKPSNRKWQGDLPLLDSSLESIFIYAKNSSLMVYSSKVGEDFKKSNEGNAKLRIIMQFQASRMNNANQLVDLIPEDKSGKFYTIPIHNSQDGFESTATSEIIPGLYNVIVHDSNNLTKHGDEPLGKINLFPGGSYLFIATPDHQNSSQAGSEFQLVTLTTPNEVHMLWLIPQYVLMAWAEILFIVSGMEFSFTQAPKSMKSVLQSLWHLMNAFGNIIVIASAQVKYDHSQATEFFGFSAAMFLDTVIFCLLATRYTYVDHAVSLRNSVRDSNDNKERGNGERNDQRAA